MLIQNKSQRIYQHSFFNDKGALEIISIAPHQVKDVDAAIAAPWLKTGDVVEYADPKAQASLKDENEKLKAELAALKGKTENKPEVSLEELKKEADALGIKYAPNIGVKKLSEKIKLAKGE